MSEHNAATEQQRAARLHREYDRVWGNWPGWGQLAAVNHTSVGLRFIVTGLFFFLVGGVLAMLMRTQLALPEQDIVGPELYNQLFTMHGTLMMFLFAIPVLEGVAMYLIPKMVGARDLPFPRLGAMGYFCYLFGGLIILSSMVFAIAPDSGWFMYTPLSSSTFSPGPGSDFWLLGITFVEISSVSGAIELVVSILRTRSSGMSLRRMPIFCWYILVMALMIIVGFPPLILASVLLELERAAGFVFFEVAGGGDPLLWQHLFWLFGHPEVYIIFLPAAGIVSTLIPVFAQRPIVGYRWLVQAVITMGFISFGLWVHHMFTVGIPQLAQAFFSLASMLVAIPTAIQIFAWLATLWTGRVVWGLPMLWIMGFLVIFVAGGLTGVMLAMVPLDWQVHDTHFVVAHLHYVLIGGMMFPLFAALYYWLPHVSGRMPSEQLGRWAFWLIFIGFNMTFLLMHVTGLLGMPRRIYTYQAGLGWDWLNLLSSIGGFVMAFGVGMLIVDLLLHFRFGRQAPRNPWNADTLEWAVAMPVSTYNFISLPHLESRHPMWDDRRLPDRLEAGKGALVEIQADRRVTWGSDVVTGEVREIIHVPSSSWIPLQTGVLLAIVCLGLLTKFYWVALGAALVGLAVVLRWSWHNGGHPRAAPLRDDDPQGPLLHSRTCDGPGLWGMWSTLLANGSLFASLLFGWFYFWTVSPQWQAPAQGPLPALPMLLAGLLVTAAALLYQRLVRRLCRGEAKGLDPGLWLSALFGLTHVLLLLWVLIDADLQPRSLAHDAVLAVMLGYLLFHAAMATILTVMQALRVRLGYVSEQLPYEPVVLRPWWTFTLAVFWISFAGFILLPLAW